MDDISKRLEFLVGEHTGGKATIFAKNAGIPASTFQYYIKGRMPHGDHLKRICEFYNVNLNWLLTGKGSPYIKEDVINSELETHTPPSSSNVIEMRHMELVKGFSDKQRAYEINRELMELEKLDRDAFRRIESYIKGTVDQVRSAAERVPFYGPDRRKAERRIGGGGDNMPEGGNRRTGKDRRK